MLCQSVWRTLSFQFSRWQWFEKISFFFFLYSIINFSSQKGSSGAKRHQSRGTLARVGRPGQTQWTYARDVPECSKHNNRQHRKRCIRRRIQWRHWQNPDWHHTENSAHLEGFLERPAPQDQGAGKSEGACARSNGNGEIWNGVCDHGKVRRQCWTNGRCLCWTHFMNLIGPNQRKAKNLRNIYTSWI